MRSSYLRVALGVASLAVAVLAPAVAAADKPASGGGHSSPIAQAFPLAFDSESLRVDIVGDSLELRGTYTLLCRSPVEESIPLFYPFPIDSLLGGARMVSLAFRMCHRSP